MYFTAQQRHVTEHPYEAETAPTDARQFKLLRWKNFVAVSHNADLRELGQIWAAKTEEELAGEKI